MTKCDRCSSDVRVSTTLKHVSFDKTPISRMVSTYTVCNDCFDEMKDDDDITW